MFGRRKCLIEQSPCLPELLFFLYGFICQGSVLPDNCSLLRNTQNSDFLFKLWPNSQSVSTKYELLCAWFPWLNLWSHIWTFGICGIFWEQLLGNEILIYWVLVRLVIVDIKKKTLPNVLFRAESVAWKRQVLNQKEVGAAGHCSHVPESVIMLSAAPGSHFCFPCSLKCLEMLFPLFPRMLGLSFSAAACSELSLRGSACSSHQPFHMEVQGRQPLMRIVKVRKENVVVSKFQGELIIKNSAPSDVLAGW